MQQSDILPPLAPKGTFTFNALLKYTDAVHTEKAQGVPSWRHPLGFATFYCSKTVTEKREKGV